MKRENFSSRLAVIFVMAGSAIGLGNIWRFPYMVGEHGGAAFVLLYILATMLVSLPLFITEVAIGRRSRTNASHSMAVLAPGRGFWKFIGIFFIIIPMIIASYYSVIGGWSMTYLVKAAMMEFVRQDASSSGEVFSEFISSPVLPVVAHLVFFLICAFVVALGVKSGIEKFSKITIPVLFVLIVVMMIYSFTLPGAGAGVNYLMKPDFSMINAKSFAYAMGQSFYSLSLGMGAIMTYGSYVSKDENIIVSSAGTAVSDLLFALLAGLAIMPAVFAAGIEPGAGPGLIFEGIPFIFASFGQNFPVISTIVSVIFFLAVVVAAMTSIISLIEVGASFLSERFGMKRMPACMLIFLVCGGVGVLCSLSFGCLSGFTVGGMCLFDLFDWFSSNVMLLLMAFLTVIFAGFVMKKEDLRDELTNGGTKPIKKGLFNLLYFLIKWVAPVFVLLIFIANFIL